MNRKALLTAPALLLAALLLAGGPAGAIGNKRQVAFGLSGICTGCHGLPPVSTLDLSRIGAGYASCAALAASSRNERCGDYPGGGGTHWAHVSRLRTTFQGDATGYDDQCGQCHGLDPGGALWHLECDPYMTTFNWGSGASWPTVCQELVDMVDGLGNFRAGGTPNTSSYSGRDPDMTVFSQASAAPASNAKGGYPQQCQNLNCHGPGTPGGMSTTSAGALGTLALGGVPRLMWNAMEASLALLSTTFGRDLACSGCHGYAAIGSTVPTDLRINTYVGAIASQGVTANYYGTVSGYSRGGHGDAAINASDDPSFVNSARGATPVPCTGCHSHAAPHFPPSSSNPYRLTTGTSWGPGSAAAVQGLCLSQACHNDGAPYFRKDRHHPSYIAPTKDNPTSHDIVPHASQEVHKPITTWGPVVGTGFGPNFYEQDGYMGATVSGHPDPGVDWWGGNRGPTRTRQSPPPKPVFYGQPSTASPKATLPLEGYLLGAGSSERVLCSTCHNPHGTDLYVYEGTTSIGLGKNISDNNMLRLRDSDNTLCDACH